MTSLPPSFLNQLQRRTAEAAIGASSLRNQGAPGVVGAARGALAHLDLDAFSRSRRPAFRCLLDTETRAILSKFPAEAQSWGAARKALNLFLRDALYNQHLCARYELDRIRSWLEVPLDKYAALGILAEPEGGCLPDWHQIKTLTPSLHQDYQSVATNIARRKRITRVDLDVLYWRSRNEV